MKKMKHKHCWNSNTDFVLPLNEALQTSICGQSQITFVKPMAVFSEVSILKSQASLHFYCPWAMISFPLQLYCFPFYAPF